MVPIDSYVKRMALRTLVKAKLDQEGVGTLETKQVWARYRQAPGPNTRL